MLATESRTCPGQGTGRRRMDGMVVRMHRSVGRARVGLPGTFKVL